MTDGDMRWWLEAVNGEGVSVHDSQEAYRQWAGTYEKDAERYKFNGHLKVASILKDLYPEIERDKIRILDIGAGTGLVGKEVKKYGFQHIDALEPSEAMMNEAKKANVYENYFVEFLTESPTSVLADSYDVITGGGVYGRVHIPCEALYEMIRIVRPGGYIIIVANYDIVRTSKMYEGLETLMDKLEANGKWKKVSRETWETDYGISTSTERISWCYRIL